MAAALLVLLCVVFRVVPHPANLSPVGAAAVFAGRTLPRRAAIAGVLGVMLLTDVLLGRLHGHSYVNGATPFVYAGFVVQVLLGSALRRRRGGAIAASLAGSTAFFLLSNLGVFIAGRYGHTGSGLVACYVAAIPFFGRTLVSDLLFTIALSLGFAQLSKRLPAAWSGARETLPAV